jgi:penicillin V acylase-like amidase (Ntn superfamily)
MKLKMCKIRGGVIAAAILVAAPYNITYACSRVLWNTSDKGAFVSRSVDWYELIDPEMTINPRGMNISGGLDKNAAKWTSKFGNIVVNATNYDNAGLDGMNEEGLTAHLLYLYATKYEERDERPGVSYLNWLRYILDNNGTVAEAVNAMNQIQIVPVPIRGRALGAHVAMEDPSGDSAIIEFIEGKMVVHHGRQYAVMTNDPPYDVAIEQVKEYKGLGGTKELPGDIDSFDRFVRAEYFLKYLPQPKDNAQAVAFVYQIIHNVAVPFGAPYGGGLGVYPTWWFSAADLADKVYYFSMTDSPNVIWVDVSNLNFSEGQPVMRLDPKNPALVGDVSRGFQRVARQ